MKETCIQELKAKEVKEKEENGVSQKHQAHNQDSSSTKTVPLRIDVN